MDRADWIELTEAPLPVAEALAWVVQPGCGAVDVFCGTVRDHSEDRRGVEGLEYEAYEPLVVPRCKEIAHEARRRWPEIGRLVVLHRIGSLAVGEISVVIAVSTPHRASVVRRDPLVYRHPEGDRPHLEARSSGKTAPTGGWAPTS